jgi:hypothetical protein
LDALAHRQDHDESAIRDAPQEARGLRRDVAAVALLPFLEHGNRDGDVYLFRVLRKLQRPHAYQWRYDASSLLSNIFLIWTLRAGGKDLNVSINPGRMCMVNSALPKISESTASEIAHMSFLLLLQRRHIL